MDGRGGWRVVTADQHGKAYVDMGAEYYERQYRERVLKNLAKRAAQFDLALIRVTPIEGPAA